MSALLAGPAVGVLLILLVIVGLVLFVLLALGLCKAAAKPMPEDFPSIEDPEGHKRLWLDEDGERRP